MDDQDKLWEKFCSQFDEALFECIEKGQDARMTLGVGDEQVSVDIYRTKGGMKKFNSMILEATKQATGIDLVKKPTDSVDREGGK